MSEVSIFRLYLIRAKYLLIAVGLATTIRALESQLRCREEQVDDGDEFRLRAC